MKLELSDLDRLKDAAIAKFDQRLATSDQEQALNADVVQLQACLEQIYRVVVLLQKNEASMDSVAEIWSKMVVICDEFARRLSELIERQPVHRNTYDRILDLRNAAEERRLLHSRP